MIRWIIFVLWVFNFNAFAQDQGTPGDPPAGETVEVAKAPAKPKPKTKAQYGVVGPEGALVFKSPDFDSPQLAQLPPGLKVVMSLKKVPGRSGLGAFHKVRFEKSKIGYIADTELIPEFQKVGKQTKKNPVFENVEEMRERAMKGIEPIYLTRYLGAQFGMIGYAETYAGHKLSQDMLMYGIKATGPGTLFDGPPLDASLLFSMKPGPYYDDYARSPPNGFIVLTDVSLLLPLFEKNSFLFYCGLGGMATYSKVSFQTVLDTVDNTSFRLGVLGQLAAAFRHKKWVVRGDAKYYYEKHSYLGYSLSLQHEY
jgi:hypothetical protein